MNMSQSIAAKDDSAISLRGLTKRFGDLVAVDNVDLEIAKGELLGLLGPNGANKTTIIKMLTTMLRPTEGEARVWGHNVTKERNEVRSSIGLQHRQHADRQREPGLSRKNVRHGRIASQEENR